MACFDARGLARGLRGKGSPVPEDSKAQILRLFEQPDTTVRRAALHVLEVAGLSNGKEMLPAMRRAESTASNPKADPELRADSIGLLAIGDVKERRAALEQLVKPTEPEAVQIAAVRAMGHIPGEETATFLLKNWRGMTANVRTEAADALYRDPARIPLVLAALQKGDIQPWTLAFRHRSRLVMHQDPVSSRAPSGPSACLIARAGVEYLALMIELFSSETRRNPYPLYEQFRSRTPLLRAAVGAVDDLRLRRREVRAGGSRDVQLPPRAR